MNTTAFTAAVAALLFASIDGLVAQSKTWYVRKYPMTTGTPDGTLAKPYNTLKDVETNSIAGDTIMVIASDESHGPLDDGIMLKTDQRLLGMGAKVTTTPLPKVRAWITNKTVRHTGDAVVLAEGAEVGGIHISDPTRCGVLCSNFGNVSVHDLLVENWNTTNAQAPKQVHSRTYSLGGIQFFMTNTTVAKPSRVTDCVLRGGPNGNGVAVETHNSSKASVVVRGTSVADTIRSGFRLVTFGTSDGKLTVEQSSADNIGGEGRGVAAWSNEQTRMQLDVSGFTFDNSKRLTDSWRGVEMVFSGDSKALFRVEDSTIRDQTMHGILAISWQGSALKGDLDVHVEDVSVIGSTVLPVSAGISLGAFARGNLANFTATVKNNFISVMNTGIEIYSASSSVIDDAQVVVDGNVIDRIGGNGLAIASDSAHGKLDITATRNVIGRANVGIFFGYAVKPTTLTALLANNLVHGCKDAGIAVGSDSPTFVNNTSVGNGTYGLSTSLAATPTFTNGILWGNTSGGVQATGTSAATITYSDVQGGATGNGNIKTDPLFVDGNNGDYHLRYDSPCKNKGSNAAVPVALKTDFEGDPRVADSTADMGADEFFTHLYYTGALTPSGTAKVNAIGAPNSAVTLGISAFHGSYDPGIPVPGIGGLLFVKDPILLVPMNKVATTGHSSLSVIVPSGFPKVKVWTQALIGSRFSNLGIVTVK